MQEQIQSNIVPLENFVTTADLQSRTIYMGKRNLQVPEDIQEPQRARVLFDSHKQAQESDRLQSYQLKDYMIYLFARNYENSSKITMYSFKKSDGSNTKKIYEEITDNIQSMTLMLYHSKPLAQSTETQACFKILIGSNYGTLKILDTQPPHQLKTVKIDTKPIIMIKAGDYANFHDQNICVVLSKDNFVYFVDLDINEVAYVLRPSIMMSDTALSISINFQYSHLLQTTHGGYVIFWKMDTILLKLLERKQQKINNTTPTRHHGIKCRIEHAMTIQGLIWCDFYGNLLIMITQDGTLKVVAYIFQPNGEFIELLSFKIARPQKIKHVLFHPQLDMVLVSKNLESENEQIIEKIQLDKKFRVERVVTIVLVNIDQINQFHVNKDFDILICQGKQLFLIDQCNDILEQEEKHFQGQKTLISDY